MQFLLLDKDLIFDKNLTGNEYRIYSCLLFLYNKEKQCSYPSIEVISEKLNISISTIKRSIKKLCELGYMTIEKKKGIAGNYNVYKKLKHLISNKTFKKKDNKIKVDSTKKVSLDEQVDIDSALKGVEEVKEVDKLDNNFNVRLARSVVNIDNSGFAKKVISLANKDLLREAIRDFKIKGGRSSTFLIKLLVDQYYKSGVSLSKPLFNLLKRDYVVV